MKIALFCEQDPRQEFPFAADSHEILGKVGLNFGNLAFWYGTSSLITSDIKYFGWSSTADEIRDCDCIVIPAANWLNNDSDFGFLAEIIDELDKPVLVLGLGVQCKSNTKEITLSDGTVDFLHSVRTRTSSILVRGDATKQFLLDNGISNVQVFGCPSLFLNSEARLGEVIQGKLDSLAHRGIKKTAIHALNEGDENLRRVERVLFSLGLQKGNDYIIQSSHEIVKLLLSEDFTPEDSLALDKLSEFISPNSDRNSFKDQIKQCASFYTNINSWILRLRQMDCTLNTRIHGALLGTAAETPSICITHDLRTMELAESTCIPRINVDAVQNWDLDIRELFEASSFEAEKFDDNRFSKARILSAAMTELGISISDKLVNLSSI